MVRSRHVRSGGTRARTLVVTLACTLVFALSGCTNNSAALNSLKGQLTSSGISGNNNSSGNLFTITQVVKSNVDPTAQFDIIGDGSGSINSFCSTSSGVTPTPGGTTRCQCEFTYTLPGTSNTLAPKSPVTYVENNLARCAYNTAITGGPDTIAVRIIVSGPPGNTNTINFSFGNSNSGSAIDLTQPTSFSQVVRYQCKDILNIPYFFQPALNDPVLSNLYQYNYYLNFYTTNFGGARAAFAANSNSGSWNCLVNPNEYPPGENANRELQIWSVGPDTTSSIPGYAIHDPTGSLTTNNRSTFYIPRVKAGVFTQPINAMIAPNVNTTSDGTSYTKPIGYGVPPSPYNGGEVCPDNPNHPFYSFAQIPSNMRWVKLWLFRGSLPQRRFYLPNILHNLGPVACNPGKYDGSSDALAVFTDCSQNTKNPSAGAPTYNVDSNSWFGIDDYVSANTFHSTAYGGATVSSPLVARAFYTASGNSYPLCMMPVDPITQATETLLGAATPNRYFWSPSNASTFAAGRAPAGFTSGGDVYERIGGDYTVHQQQALTQIYWDITTGAATQYAGDKQFVAPPPPNVGAGPNFAGWPSDGNTHLGAESRHGILRDTNLTTNNIDQSSRFDFLFVVSPTSINYSDMKQGSSNSAVAPYFPYRLRHENDCRDAGNNVISAGNNPTTTCNAATTPAEAYFNYELISTELYNNPGGPAEDPNHLPSFPVCVLQPKNLN